MPRVKFNPPWKGLPVEIEFKARGWRFAKDTPTQAGQYLVKQPVYSFEKDEEYARVVEITPTLTQVLKTEGMGYNKCDLTQLGLTSGWLIILDEVGSDGSSIMKVSSAPSLEQALNKVVNEVISKYDDLSGAIPHLDSSWKNPTEPAWYT